MLCEEHKRLFHKDYFEIICLLHCAVMEWGIAYSQNSNKTHNFKCT